MSLVKILVVLFTMIAYGVMLIYEPKTKIGWILYILCVPSLAILLFLTTLFVMTL